ncbi:MAG: PKD domain-containing protein [Gemmatimonas sp.]
MRSGTLLRAALSFTALLLTACGGGGDGGGPTPPAQTPGLSVSSGATSTSVTPGATASTTITIARSGGYTGAVSLSVSGQPSTVTATVNPSTLASGVTSATVQWTAVASAAMATHVITIRAAGSGVAEATATTELVIAPLIPAGSTIQSAAGDNQTVAAGATVPVAPRVIVRNASGTPISGASVVFRTDSGYGVLADSVATTGADGTAQPGSWKPGPGRNVIVATAGSLASVKFVATGTGELSAGTGTVASGGGTVTISRPGDPLNGMSIQMPANSFTTAANVTVRYGNETGRPVAKRGMRWATPMITVENTTTGYTKGAPMRVRIPVRFKKTEWPVAFMVEPGTGKHIVVPVLPVDTTAVVLFTRHLDGALIDPAAAPALRASVRLPGSAGLREGNVALALVIGMMDITELEKELDTGYRPAVDDWEFDHVISGLPGLNKTVNLFPILSAWYYQRFRTAPLNKRFQKASGIEFSNAQGIRAAQSVELGLDPVIEYNRALLNASRELGIAPDRVMMLNVKAQIAQTGQPVVLFSAGFEKPELGILLVYRTNGDQYDVSTGTSSAGINAPRVLRMGAEEHLEATNWGIKDAETGAFTNYVMDAYVVGGLTAAIPASWLNETWRDILAGTAGNKYMPAWSFHTTLERNVKDTIFVAEDSVRMWFECASCQEGYPAGQGISPQGKVIQGTIYEKKNGTWSKSGLAVKGGGTRVDADDDGRQFGFAVVAPMGAKGVGYLDWTELVVKARKLTITPDKPTTKANENITLTATSNSKAPTGAVTYEWDLGDGRKQTTQTNTITYQYPVQAEPGEKKFEVKVRLKSGASVYATGKNEVTLQGPQPYWHITSISDQDDLFNDPDITPPTDDVGKALQRVLLAPGSGLISIEDAGGGKQELRLRVLRTSLWDPANCCPPPNSAAAEWRAILGVTPRIDYAMGPRFAGYNFSNWSQSTTDLGTGTITSQYVLGTMVYKVKDAGNQTGPQGAFRVTATRNGNVMTGMITVHVWFIDDEDGTLYPGGDDTYRMPFTAVRMR